MYPIFFADSTIALEPPSSSRKRCSFALSTLLRGCLPRPEGPEREAMPVRELGQMGAWRPGVQRGWQIMWLAADRLPMKRREKVERHEASTHAIG